MVRPDISTVAFSRLKKAEAYELARAHGMKKRDADAAKRPELIAFLREKKDAARRKSAPPPPRKRKPAAASSDASKRRRRSSAAAPAAAPPAPLVSFEQLLASEREGAQPDPALARQVSEYRLRRDFAVQNEDGTWAQREGLESALAALGEGGDENAAPSSSVNRGAAREDPKLAAFVDDYLSARRRREAVFEAISDLAGRGRRREAIAIIRAMSSGTLEIEEDEFEYVEGQPDAEAEEVA